MLQNANDLNFPVQGDLYWWYLMVTGKPGQTYRIEVFSNRTALIDRLVMLNQEGAEHLWLFGTAGASFYNPPSGPKVYVKMTEQ